MVAKSIEVTNGCYWKLNLLGDGLTVSHTDKKGKIDESFVIEDDELVMLINLYIELKQQDEKSVCLMNDFVRRILQGSYSYDCVTELQIIQ